MSIEFNNPQSASPEKKKVTVEDVKVFGDKLRRARNELGKNATEIALEIGVNRRSPVNWENGEEFPDESRLEKIAEVYQLDKQELYEAYRISKEARELEKGARMKRRN